MKSIVVGFDAFDPSIFEDLYNQGKMPNLGRYVDNGSYARLQIANPAQSEVSWTSLATGLNPGGHGIFDFVHRNPSTYALHVSMLPTTKKLMGVQFMRAHNAPTLFDAAVQQGYPATSLWWPVTFPARFESPVRTLPGLGTPDILGRLGAGIYFSPITGLADEAFKTNIELLQDIGEGRYRGLLPGPSRKKGAELRPATLQMELDLGDKNHAHLKLDKQNMELTKGIWSPIFQLAFPIKFGLSVKAITRVILTEFRGSPGLYFLPLQIHPLYSPWPYASPRGFAKSIWKTLGPFLTLGWPQDTTGLEEGFLDDEQFLDLCEAIHQTRERIFLNQVQDFHEGILASVFDTLDRVQHMFWRDRPQVVARWYEKLDRMLGRIEAQVEQLRDSQPAIYVLSDHGFAPFEYKVHLNRWLMDQGFLNASTANARGGMKDIDWSQSRAYALGLNSIYLNQQGREAEGIVAANQVEEQRNLIREQLTTWKGPDGSNVAPRVYRREEVFEGPLSTYSPDLVVGFNRGYRASAQTGLGGWEEKSIEVNEDHWGADHCIDPQLVSGVLFSNRSLHGLSQPSYRDFPELVTGEALDAREPPTGEAHVFHDEEEQILEERLKDLGYL